MDNQEANQETVIALTKLAQQKRRSRETHTLSTNVPPNHSEPLESLVSELSSVMGRGKWTPHLTALRRQLSVMAPLRQRAMEWHLSADQFSPISSTDLMRALSSGVYNGLVLALSHDDCVRTIGGVQILISDEQLEFARAGWSYLHVSPAAPLPMLADAVHAGDYLVALRLNSEWVGVTTFADLMEAVSAHRARGVTVECVVHHFLGHAPELALALFRASGATRPVVWVHDFFTICPSFALMRNDVAYCGAPPMESAACAICCYGTERKRHVERMHEFFSAARPAVLAPSKVALELWCRRGGLPHAEVAVMPHARLLTAASDRSDCASAPERALRVAYLGSPVLYKGWDVFEVLARELADDDRYQFLQLGSAAAPDSSHFIRHIPVCVAPERRYAMIEAVAEAGVDVALFWSLCFETFSLSVYEALAGGAFVVARAGAGNVWPAVQENGPVRGCAVADEVALFALFAGDELRARVDASPKCRGALMPQGCTARWLLPGEKARRVAEGRVAKAGSVLDGVSDCQNEDRARDVA